MLAWRRSVRCCEYAVRQSVLEQPVLGRGEPECSRNGLEFGETDLRRFWNEIRGNATEAA